MDVWGPEKTKKSEKKWRIEKVRRSAKSAKTKKFCNVFGAKSAKKKFCFCSFCRKCKKKGHFFTIDCPGLKFFEKQRVSPLNFSTFSPFS
jgi:hypothetical protein